jgi:hypothetical protein
MKTFGIERNYNFLARHSVQFEFYLAGNVYLFSFVISNFKAEDCSAFLF